MEIGLKIFKAKSKFKTQTKFQGSSGFSNAQGYPRVPKVAQGCPRLLKVAQGCPRLPKVQGTRLPKKLPGAWLVRPLGLIPFFQMF